MAGIEDAGLTVYTVKSGEFFPTSDDTYSFAPLTTSFTFASSCSEQWRVLNANNPTQLEYPIPSSCLPGGNQRNSPGTCLPSYRMFALAEFRTPGWTLGGVRAWGAACCRDDMTLQVFSGSICSSVFSTPMTGYNPLEVASLSTNSFGEAVTYTRVDPTATDNITVLSTGTMVMAPMFIYWQESDLSNFDAEYAATLASKFDIDFTPTATADVTAETAAPSHRSQLPTATLDSGEATGPLATGLSSGAKAGIGVGVAIGATILVVAGVMVYKRRSRKRTKILDRNSAIQNAQPEFVQTQMRTQTQAQVA